MGQTLAQTKRDDLSAPESKARVEPSVYVALEGERPLSGGLRVSLAKVDELRIGRGANRSFRIEDDGRATLEIPDPRMSSKHARLVREEDGWLVEDLGSTNGTFVEMKRVTSAAIEEATVVTLGATCLIVDPAESVPEGPPPTAVDSSSLRARPRGTATLVPMVEHATPRLVRVAMSKLSMLLLGESGAGKEVLARTIHALSGRSGPFVALNCGALAPTLVESQLFGYVKGAFSGATRDEPGLIRSSSGGTLFLDEIGELPASAQATLLRVLQEREVLPVGGTKPVPVDLRVVAATLKPIGPRAEGGAPPSPFDGADDGPAFRPDLYARVAAFVHRLVPLRERRGDVGILIADLLPRIASERAPRLRIAPDLGTALVAHSYPLNVRELEHLLSVAIVTSLEDLLRLEHAGGALTPPKTSERPASASSPPSTPSRQLSDTDLKLKEELVAALTRTRGNVSEISRAMKKTRMQIHRWMKRFGLDPDAFRG